MRKPDQPLLRLCAAVFLLGGIAVPTVSAAEDVGVGAYGPGFTADDAPLGAPSELRIDLVGEVAARCSMASAPAPSPLDLNHGGETEAEFTLDCNAPFRMRVISEEGGLLAETARDGVASVVPYDVGFTIGTDQGARPLGWCSAAQLADTARAHCPFGRGSGWSSDAATAIDRTSTLNLRWSDPSAAEQPAMGRYRDTITIELSVRS